MQNYDSGWRRNTKTGGLFNIYDDYEPNKERNMKHAQADSARLNKESHLPRRLYLPDVSAETANKTTDILDLGTKQRFTFKSGSKITEVQVFAGKGCSKEFRDAEKYARRWGGKKEDWQHCAGQAQITNGRKVFNREIHWVQGADGKMREAFIKYKY